MSYICRHFRIEELVPKHVFEARGQKAWQLLDIRTLITQDALRERYGKIIVNDWVFGGDSQWRGLRTPESPVFSLFSQHTYGRAFDDIFMDVLAEEVRQDIIAHPDLFPHIHAMEEGVSWLHHDTRNCDPIMLFSK